MFFCESFRTSCCISTTNLKNPTISGKIVGFWICRRNTKASTETFTENKFGEGRNFALHFTSYLSIELFKILSHSKTIKTAKKLLILGNDDSRSSAKFLQTHIFWKFDHVSRTSNQINYRNVWFAKVIIILIMTA